MHGFRGGGDGSAHGGRRVGVAGPGDSGREPRPGAGQLQGRADGFLERPRLLARRQDGGGTQANSSAEWMFTKYGHDCGPVPGGPFVRHNFVMTNRLNEAVTVLDIRASCGCTSGRASATSVAPGQQANIEAQMDTRNFVG